MVLKGLPVLYFANIYLNLLLISTVNGNMLGSHLQHSFDKLHSRSAEVGGGLV